MYNDKMLSHDISILLKTMSTNNKVISREDQLEQIHNANLKITANEAKAKSTPIQVFKWENKKGIKYCPLPRFLIVEDNFYGRLGVVDELKKMSFKYSIDVASDGADAVDKFKILLNKGYIFDFIFMDIVLIEMDGTEATRIIRDFERDYHVHTNIVSISVERQANFEEGLFDENCKYMSFIL